MSSLILNNIKGIEKLSYLELGVNKAKNFNAINSKNKMSVDINGFGLFKGTTDDFFKSISKDEKYDIIFIDANHDYDFVINDFNNSIEHCKQWILIHDMIPPNEAHTASNFCSDSYKILYYFLENLKDNVYPMDENFGLTFIKMPAEKINPKDHYRQISFQQFEKFIKTQKLYSQKEIIEILNKDQNV